MLNFHALCPTFEKLFNGAKVKRKAQKLSVGRKTVYEIDPWSDLQHYQTIIYSNVTLNTTTHESILKI